MDTKQLIIALLNEDLRTFKAGVETILEQRIDEAIENLKKETIAEMGLKCRKEQQVIENEEDLCEDEEQCCEKHCDKEEAVEEQCKKPIEEQCEETIEEQVDNDQNIGSEDQEDLEDRNEDSDGAVEGNEVTVYADDDVEVECKCTKKTKKAKDDADGEEAESAKSEEDAADEIRDELNKSEQEDEK